MGVANSALAMIQDIDLRELSGYDGPDCDCGCRQRRNARLPGDRAQEELVGQIRGDVKNHVKKGGWSQKRFQRRRDNQLQQYAREVSMFLSELAEREPFDRMVLVGSEEATVAIEAELNQGLVDRIIARDSIDLKAGDETLVSDAFDHYWKAERSAEKDLWRQIKAEYASGGLAAVGATAVLEAVQSGRIEAIVVERDASLPGVRCASCDNTFHGTPHSCQICGGKSLTEIDLVNELVRQAELTGATMEFADPIPALSSVGHVAALLRY